MKPPVTFRWHGAAEAGETAAWVAARIPHCARGWARCVALSVWRGARIGGVVYHDWNPDAGTIQMSAAGGDGWLTRPVLQAMHEYPFSIGCQMIVLQTAVDNRTMRRIGKAYGYRETIIPRLMGRAADASILTLTDDDWRASRFYRGNPDGQT